MATDFPTSLDTFDEPSSPSATALSSAGDSSPARTHVEHHRDLGDAVEALQAKVGVDSSAVTTSHDYKLRQVSQYMPDVKTTYGAVGDGSTDDTTALQNALNANKVVFIPPGNYRITSELYADPDSNDHCGFVGLGTLHSYATHLTSGRQARIFYDGTASNSVAVIRSSREAVGVQPSPYRRQTLTINAAGGTYTITFRTGSPPSHIGVSTFTTSALAPNAASSTVQTALLALGTDTTVSAASNGVVTSALSSSNLYVAALPSESSGMVRIVDAGDTTQVAWCSYSGTSASGGNHLTGVTYLSGARFTMATSDPVYSGLTSGDVTVTGNAGGPYTITFADQYRPGPNLGTPNGLSTDATLLTGGAGTATLTAESYVQQSTFGFVLHNVELDGNDKAGFGLYTARAQNVMLDHVGVTGTNVAGISIQGSYSGTLRSIRAYANNGRGIELGGSADRWGWNRDFVCNAVYGYDWHCYGNGSDPGGTPTSDDLTTLSNAAGVFLQVHRGCAFYGLVSEANYGANIVFAPTGNGNVISGVYTEIGSNGAVDDGWASKKWGLVYVGQLDYGASSLHNRVVDGMLSGDHIWLTGTQPSSGQPAGAFELYNISLAGGLTADWGNYRAVNCPPALTTTLLSGTAPSGAMQIHGGLNVVGSTSASLSLSLPAAVAGTPAWSSGGLYTAASYTIASGDTTSPYVGGFVRFAPTVVTRDTRSAMAYGFVYEPTIRNLSSVGNFRFGQQQAFRDSANMVADTQTNMRGNSYYSFIADPYWRTENSGDWFSGDAATAYGLYSRVRMSGSNPGVSTRYGVYVADATLVSGVTDALVSVRTRTVVGPSEVSSYSTASYDTITLTTGPLAGSLRDEINNPSQTTTVAAGSNGVATASLSGSSLSIAAVPASSSGMIKIDGDLDGFVYCTYSGTTGSPGGAGTLTGVTTVSGVGTSNFTLATGDDVIPLVTVTGTNVPTNCAIIAALKANGTTAGYTGSSPGDAVVLVLSTVNTRASITTGTSRNLDIDSGAVVRIWATDSPFVHGDGDKWLTEITSGDMPAGALALPADITYVSPFLITLDGSAAVGSDGTYTWTALETAPYYESQTVTITGLSVLVPAGAMTTQHGVYIENLDAATTNVGIRNLSSTELGSAQQLTVDTSGNLTTSGTAAALKVTFGAAGTYSAHVEHLTTGDSTAYTIDTASKYHLGVKLNTATTWTAAPFATASYYGVYCAPTIKNGSAAAVSLTGVRAFVSVPTITIDTQTGRGTGSSYDLIGFPTYSIANGGTITSGTHYGAWLSGSVGSGVTLTTRYGVYVGDTTGAGTVTTAYGLYIEAMSDASTSVGIRNLSSTELGSSQQLTVDTSGNLSTSGTLATTSTSASALAVNTNKFTVHGTSGNTTVAGTLDATGAVTGATFSPAGLTGATAASRYVGATASGAPASGTFAIGDFIIDRTGSMYVCTVAGSPGTWVAPSGGASTSASYITATAEAGLSNETALSSVITRQAGNPTGTITGQLNYNTTDSKMYRYNGSSWDAVGEIAGAASILDDLGDVAITGVANYDILGYNGTTWLNIAATGTGSPVRATSPTLTTPSLSAPTATGLVTVDNSSFAADATSLVSITGSRSSASATMYDLQWPSGYATTFGTASLQHHYIDHRGTTTWSAAPTNPMGIGVNMAAAIQASTVNLNNWWGFRSAPTIRATGSTALTAGTGSATNGHYGFVSSHTYTTTSTGTLTVARHEAFRAAGTISGTATTTVTDYYGLYVAGPTLSGSGAVTNLYGIYVPALTAGGTINKGIVNLSSTELGSTGQLTVDTSGNLATSGSVLLSSTNKVGYTTGAGGTVTQTTDKSTGVTLNTTCGQITMNNATLNANTTVSFTLTNSTIAAGDVLILNHISGGSTGAYMLNAQSAAGSASIAVRNVTAGNLSQAIVIAFAVVKATTS